MACPPVGDSQNKFKVKMEPKMAVAKHADVVLKLGREGKATTNVLVSSVALGLASPVFEAMFSGRFSEGQNLSVDSPREVPLPDDDPHSVLLICMIAHLRTADLPKRLDPATLADFAVACDKYQCCEAVQAWAKLWCITLLQAPSPADLEKVLFATYVLDLAYEFRHVSLVFIRNRSDNVKIQHASHGYDFIPAFVFDRLRSERRQCEVDAYKALSAVTSGLRHCEISTKLMGATIFGPRTAGAWPFGTSSISKLKSLVKDMDVIESIKCHSDCYCNSVPDIKSSLVAALNNVYHSVKGLCLDCVKRKAFGTTRVCRVPHPGAITKT